MIKRGLDDSFNGRPPELSQDEIQGFTQLCHVPYGTLPVDAGCTSHDDCKSGFCVANACGVGPLSVQGTFVGGGGASASGACPTPR